MDNRVLLQELGIDTSKIKKQGKTTCPKCSHKRKSKKDPCLSVNIESGLYRCHNCGWYGSVFKKTEKEIREYKKPVFVNRTELSKNVVDWFFTRGIRQQTLIDLKVTESNDYMPQLQRSVQCINFNYFRGGELVNIKYRGEGKSFKLFSGAELIFYNIDSISEYDTAIIVEGEMDVLALHEAGIKNVISVPNGASMSNGSPNLEYLDNSISDLSHIRKFVIATDNDGPGISLRDELARRLGYHRCYKVDFGDVKDANDYLMKYGPEKLNDIFSENNLKEFPIGGVVTANDIWDEMEDLFKNGLERGATTGVMSSFDDHVSFVPGHLMVVTGIPNHGKSPFTMNVACGLAKNHGWKFAIFSPEHKPLKIFIATILETLIGKRMRKGVGFSDSEKKMAKEFLENHFYFIEPEDDDCTIENVLSITESLVFRKGVRGLIVDPWNKFEHKIRAGETETNYISRALDTVIRFSQNHGVFTFIIAHPTKMKKNKDELHEVPTLYDISGSGNWFNKADWGISFYRNYATQENTVYIQKAKWLHLGKQGHCVLKYNPNNSRFNPIEESPDNSNWTFPKESQSNLFQNTPPEVSESPF